MEPVYVRLITGGELSRRADEARRRLAQCDFCAHRCGVNRLGGHLGQCRTGAHAAVCSYHPHFGEEVPLVGRHGSGTIFFAWCNLHCVFCQNYELSALGEGREVEPDELAAMMLELQAMGCHNINLVSPSHVVPQWLAALAIAADKGLRLPIVYNSGGYDCLETLALLDGIVDIYMPDMKYADPDVAAEYSGAKDYPQVNQAAVKEMHRQVGDLTLDRQGTAIRGLLVRHLVLPNNLAGTETIARFLATEVSKDTYINIMDQYRPSYRAPGIPHLNRRITPQEYQKAVQAALDAGLHRLDNRQSRLRAMA